MNHEKLAGILNKNEIKGIIVALDEKGGVAFSKNCDIMSLMILKSFVDYNVQNSIQEAMDNNGKAQSNQLPRLNIPMKKN